MADESSNEKDEVLSRLWDVAHKYQRSLARGDVVPMAESEADRESVAPFGERLHSTAERNLDGITYRSLAEMQVHRDSRRLLSNLPARVRLQRLAFEVAVRAKPVVFVHAPATARAGGLLAAIAYEADSLETGEPDLPLADGLDDSEYRVRMNRIDEAELEQMQADLRQRLSGERTTLRDLAGRLTSVEADLLSQLARRGELLILADGHGGIEIESPTEDARKKQTVAVVLKPSQRRT